MTEFETEKEEFAIEINELYERMKLLSEYERRIVSLRIEGFYIDEIAEVVHRSSVDVKVALGVAIDKLRKSHRVLSRR